VSVLSGAELRPVGPVRGLSAGRAYGVPRGAAAIDLFLDGNEGPRPSRLAIDASRLEDAERIRRYPAAGELEARLARRLGVSAGQVLVTAGADDSLLRICLALLGPGRELVLPAPTFEMIPRYASLAESSIVDVPWMGDRYPIEGVLAAITPRTALVAVVSPNNPTGAVATPEDLRRISAAAPHAWILLDEAYAEYAREPLTEVGLALPNVLVVRSLSKAWGLAGLRVGYVVGPEEALSWLRRAGNPYPTSGPSLALALERLDQADEVLAGVQRATEERRRLAVLLDELGLRPQASQANFLLVRGASGKSRLCDEPLWIRDGLAAQGIAVRAFPGKERLEDAVRISMPCDEALFGRLVRALRLLRSPEAICVQPELCAAAELPDRDGLALVEGGPREGSWYVLDASSDSALEETRLARSLGALPVGVTGAAGAESIAELESAGLARCIDDLNELRNLLP